MPASRIYNPFVGSGGGGGGADPNAEEIRTFPFSYNSSSPVTIIAIPAGARILDVGIQITTAFDDPAATLKIGDFTVTDRLMLVSENVPDEVGEYEAHHPYQYVGVDNILLTIAPGISTQGAGIVYIEYNLNS